ncbi:MAG TPA: hypothetical protein VFU02_02990 [Polyangiaceae bacterium]|nr:hypothetical protein [Polyangiaceae bacterium]
MTSAHGVEQAFLGLENAPLVLQSLLRPVLVRALQDPSLMRQLGSALPQHLALLGEVLVNAPAERTTLPAPRTFLHLAAGDVEDVEEAYRFAESLEAPLRTHVEAGLSQVFQLTAASSGHGTVNLLALARLLALAFTNPAFVEYVQGGGALEPFLPSLDEKRPAAKLPAKSKPKRASKSTPKPSGSRGRSRRDQKVSPELAKFVGELVEVVAVVSQQEGGDAGHVFITMGRVLEMLPGHVVLETLREDERPGSRLLLGMTRIVAMRTLPSGSVSRASKAV